jgi:LmbE family N-acetylglucosaminyl deacetylase
LTLIPAAPSGARPSILLLGAHSDDIEIGCGGTLLRLASERTDVDVHWVVFSADGPRVEEARASAAAFLDAFPRSQVRVEILEFRNAFFPQAFGDIKEYFEGLKARCAPDVIFTHDRDDRHQDHRVVAELTWNTFRDHLILEYEIPKYDGGLHDPNLFVPLTRELCERKCDLLLTHFRSQSTKHWFKRELFLGLMRVRGLEGCCPGDHAEAYTCRKVRFGWRG